MTYAVETKELTRVFHPKRKTEGKSVTALDKVDLSIQNGELFGLLGPNGAGKTTLLKILSTLLLPTSGKAFVAGLDVERDYQAVRSRINMVSGGEISGYGLLTVRENLWMFSQFYGIKSSVANARIDEMLELFGMSEKKNEKVRTLSTGQRQKMNVIRGFVTDPDILFLDEPTLGLDVNASRVIRDYIVEWVKTKRNKTVLLTTHYMAEADQLCDRVAIIDNGKIVACDTPANLKRLVRMNRVMRLEVTTLKHKGMFGSFQGVENFSYSDDLDKDTTSLRFVLSDESAVSDIVSEVIHSGSKIISLQKTEPSLEDVFVKIVGKGFE